MRGIVARLVDVGPAIGLHVERVGRTLDHQCRALGSLPEEAMVIVMLGGGKDSTLALLLTLGVAEMVGCHIKAVTMSHPGLSGATLRNIARLCDLTGERHEWRSFLEVHSSAKDGLALWPPLYRALARATGLHPRFMCVACNLGSIAVEYSALSLSRVNFVVTGNPVTETEVFERWASSLRALLSPGNVVPELTGKALLDWYRLWWVVYRELFREFGAAVVGDSAADGIMGDYAREADFGTYIYPYPSVDSSAAQATQLPILPDAAHPYRSHEYGSVLDSFGWTLPDDIPGGTESDCVMPAAIARLNIARIGQEAHLQQLTDVGRQLSSSTEMIRRSRDWVTIGRSDRVGGPLLSSFGMAVNDFTVKRTATRVADALASQLLPIR